MKKNFTAGLVFILVNLITIASSSQGIGINATSAAPDSSAMLDVQSTSKGMLIPRMSSAQRDAISLPATGLLIYNNSTGSFWFKNKNRWVELADSTNTTWTKKDTSVYLKDNENVGIGTSAPEVRLQIERGTDVGASSGGYLQLGATTNPNLAFDNNEIQARNNGSAADLLLQLNGGNIGIGSTADLIAKVQIRNGTDAGAASGGFLQLGAVSAQNLALDNNEIQSRNNHFISSLYLQNNGGDLLVGNAGSITTTNVQINHGKLLKPETGSANMMPLCYGKVSANGTLVSGSPNVNIVKGGRPGEYYINCSSITSSTIMTACPNDIHGGTKLNVAYNVAGQAFVLAVVGDTDPTNQPFSFVFYNF